MNKPQEIHIMTPEALIRGQANTSGAIAIAEEEHQFGQAPGVNLLFVDASVDNIDTLISQVKQGTQVIVLDSQTDGISQITDALSDHQNVSSLSVVSHGDSGQLQLGSSSISSASLSTYRDELQSWQSALSTNADILFYGCNVAAGQQGEHFLNQLGQLTGADIAASTDLTGSAALGGDWELEYARGEIETESPFSPKLVQSYDSVLAQYKFEGTSYRLHSKTKHGVNTVKNPSGGGDAMRIELRYGDPWVSSKRRAEVIPSVGSMKWGSTYTYELSKFIPNSWKGDSRFEILMQWHQRPDKGESWGNPPMVLDASGDRIRLRTTVEQGSKKVKKTLWSAELKKGSWIDYKFEINWSKNSNGYVKAWQNGEQIVNHKGQTANNDPQVPFMKYGIYKHNWGNKSTERVLYFKNFDWSKGSSPSNGGTKPVENQSIDTNVDTNNDSTTGGSSSTGALKIEAESLQLKGYGIESNGIASGGKLIKLTGKNESEAGTATYTHQGSGGIYDLDLSYFDENDGVSELEVQLNGQTLERWSLDGNTNSGNATESSRRTQSIDGILLDTGDLLTISGNVDGAEYARLDYLELAPSTASAPRIVNPIAKDDTFTTNEDSSLTGNVLTGAGADLAGTGSLTVVGNTNPANGSVTIQEDGNFIYTPKADFYGSDSFTYTVKNSSGGTDTATVTLTVKDINDRPTAIGTIPTQEVMDGSTVSLDVSSYFSDRDGTIASYSTKGLPKGLSINNQGIISGTIDPNASDVANTNSGSQEYRVTVTAIDDDGGVASQSFNYNIANLPEAPLKSFRVEAETLQLDTYRLESKTIASGGKMISLRGNRKNEVGKATYIHKGGSGTFDIDLRYFDENDGVSQIKVSLNGEQIDQWSLNDKTQGGYVTASTSRIHTLEGIMLSEGDRLEIMGIENESEHVRIDYLDFTSVAPQPAPIRVEAEDLAVSNYRTETQKFASGGKVLSLRGNGGGETGRATYTHAGAAGTYTMNLGYFDENDGESTIKVLLNGKQIDVWSLDENPDGSPVSAATERTRTIAGLNLQEGDRLTIVATEQAGEHARIDYLELNPELVQPLAA
ncbi:MAG: DUF4347 domain-containing protein [Cyanobacteria bacterium P01_E01_bin.34]